VRHLFFSLLIGFCATASFGADPSATPQPSPAAQPAPAALPVPTAQPAASAQPMPVPVVQHSRVYVGTDPDLMHGREVDGPAVAALTDALVMAVTGQKSVAAAWRTLVSPTDHVGIKIWAAGGSSLSTHPQIVDAVLRGIESAGVPMSQVVIWDRVDPGEAGYHEQPGGPGVRHIEPFSGYNSKAVVTMSSIGRLIWGDQSFQTRRPDPLSPLEPEQYSADSHWSKLLCGLDKIVNIPVMTTSEQCGLAGCVYNVTVPNVDNWRRFIDGPDSGDPYLSELYSDSRVGPKVVLNIMDGLVAQYGGGPEWHPNYSWNYSTLYAGKDAVAIDATALRLLEACRKAARLPPVTERAKYLQTAAEMGLGIYQPDQIDLVQTSR
jgi:uncharacterized protein (DUF362 family)